jgi:thiosulfate/3-mercaptopyruvate sulfurtransferase
VIPPIVDLASAAGRGVVWLDARWYLEGGSERGRAAYLIGHVPGARFFDLDRCGAAAASPEAGRHPLPSPEVFAACLGALGVAPDDVVVAYDDTGGAAAARVVWMLRAIGVEAALLDGGLDGWEGELEAGAPTDVVPTDVAARPWPEELLASADDTASAGTIVDARVAERFRGEVEPIDPKAGHLPGAVNVPFAGNLDDAGRWLAPDAVRARYEQAGLTADDDAVVYCGSGVTACHDLLAIERAGLGRKRLYPGGWSQWSSDPARPVETGP